MTDTDPSAPYEHLVAEMGGGVGWRDLTADLDRDPARDVEITAVSCVTIAGNFPWNLVVVETDAGTRGVGEAFTGPASEFVAYLEPGLVGENPLDVDRLAEHMTQLVSGLGGSAGYAQAAVSGVEAALHDVAGKLLDVPAYQLLGGKYRDAVRVYADCHAGAALEDAPDADPRTVYDPAAYAETAREAVDEGFDALKFDLDVPVDDPDTATRRLSHAAVDHKAAVVEAVRDAVGPEPMVGFDLHWNFTVETALELARRVEPHDPSFIEDPVPPEDVAGHRRVAEATSVPVLTGENRTRVEGFLPFLTEGAADVVAPDVQKCGGMLELRKIATVADAVDVPVAPHNVASPVGTMAAVHACAATPNAFALEFHARDVEWWDDLHLGDPLVSEGEIRVPEAPGLGVDVDWDAVADHLAPGEELPASLSA